MNIKRYKIYLVNLDPALGSEIRKTRPVVLVSDNLMNKILSTVIACPLTTKLHSKWRSRVQVVCAGNKAEIEVDQIRTLSKLRLIKPLDEISADQALILRQLISEMYGDSQFSDNLLGALSLRIFSRNVNLAAS